MNNENAYEANDTMRILGLQIPPVFPQDEVMDVLKARGQKQEYTILVHDLLTLGYLYGVHEERQRRTVPKKERRERS